MTAKEGELPTAHTSRPEAAMPDHLDAPVRLRALTEESLTDYLAGGADAFGRLVATYAPIVRAAVARYLGLRGFGSSDLADDMTHEVFLALFRNDGERLRTFEGRNGCSFAGWLRVVAVRVTIDTLRREGRQQSLDDDTRPMVELRRQLRSEAPGPEDMLLAAETARTLGDAIGRLGSKDRLLVELHLLRGASLPEVAAVLGVTANAAYVRKSRVLERLRQSLKSPQ